MSARVDSQLFSHYFGDCPVIHAQGRTHPVPTYFLEDIHDSVDYKLPSDSLASLRSNAPKQKQTQKKKIHLKLTSTFTLYLEADKNKGLASLNKSLCLFNTIRKLLLDPTIHTLC
ncbi:hypothetical protein Lser_V15G30435 [Lactuca serriola]